AGGGPGLRQRIYGWWDRDALRRIQEQRLWAREGDRGADPLYPAQMRNDPHMSAESRMAGAQPFTALLARSITASGNARPTDEQYAAARRILVDWLGVALAGTTEPVAKILRAEFASAEGAASVLGGGRASAADAALVNGTTGHALDYDDVQQFIGHPATVVVPAALAVAE